MYARCTSRCTVAAGHRSTITIIILYFFGVLTLRTEGRVDGYPPRRAPTSLEANPSKPSPARGTGQIPFPLGRYLPVYGVLQGSQRE